MCKDKIIIMSKFQSCVLHWYRTCLLDPRIDGMYVMICQHFYWPDIRKAVYTEVTNGDTCQHSKQSNKEYGKLPAKLFGEITWKNSMYI